MQRENSKHMKNLIVISCFLLMATATYQSPMAFTDINNFHVSSRGEKSTTNKRCTCNFRLRSTGNTKRSAYLKLYKACSLYYGRLSNERNLHRGRKWFSSGLCRGRKASKLHSKGFARVINLSFKKITSRRSCGQAKHIAMRACFKLVRSKYRFKGGVAKINSRCKYDKRSRSYYFPYRTMCLYIKKEIRAYYCKKR